MTKINSPQIRDYDHTPTLAESIKQTPAVPQPQQNNVQVGAIHPEPIKSQATMARDAILNTVAAGYADPPKPKTASELAAERQYKSDCDTLSFLQDLKNVFGEFDSVVSLGDLGAGLGAATGFAVSHIASFGSAAAQAVAVQLLNGRVDIYNQLMTDGVITPKEIESLIAKYMGKAQAYEQRSAQPAPSGHAGTPPPIDTEKQVSDRLAQDPGYQRDLQLLDDATQLSRVFNELDTKWNAWTHGYGEIRADDLRAAASDRGRNTSAGALAVVDRLLGDADLLAQVSGGDGNITLPELTAFIETLRQRIGQKESAVRAEVTGATQNPPTQTTSTAGGGTPPANTTPAGGTKPADSSNAGQSSQTADQKKTEFQAQLANVTPKPEKCGQNDVSGLGQDLGAMCDWGQKELARLGQLAIDNPDQAQAINARISILNNQIQALSSMQSMLNNMISNLSKLWSDTASNAIRNMH